MIPTPIVEHDGRRPERCDRCGSQGFNLHQRASKALKDPLTLRADVIRFICKRCRKTTRLYPPGVDSARQTVALRQASVLLYWLGLSYDGIRELLGHLDSPLSKATVWANVRASGLLGNRHRLRADAGTLSIQHRTDGGAANMLLRGRAVSLELVRTPLELSLTVSTLQPEAARLVYRRLEEATRRLGLETTAPQLREVVHG
ncbi:MAG: hypothetical protein IT306_13130 [Chloroflexi bacterium]|nr:hypothetical protein [Chloroflexota bacterium]